MTGCPDSVEVFQEQEPRSLFCVIQLRGASGFFPKNIVGGGRHSSGHSSSGSHSGEHRSNYANGVARDKNGHIARSEHAKNQFKKSHPCPSTGKSSGSCPGYVIDHVKPLKRGGGDDPSNMQWQTKEAAKVKDKVE